MSDGTFEPGTLLAGKFRIVRCMGQGGMGAVYEIEHELTRHRRALKLLHPAMAALPSVVERFVREASAAGRVGNPHIVETFDAGVLESGEPYLVMELLRGEPLSARIARGPLPVADVVDLVGQACAGVQAAHDVGIVHRDLKPDNLFIVETSDGRPFVKILDFGISKFDAAGAGELNLTQEGAALGTPYYMPPEQIRGERTLDARADVYALGVILYECLSGLRPFDADTLPLLAIKIHSGECTPIAQHRPDLPAGLAQLVHAALATDRHQRIPRAADLLGALERFGVVTFRTMAGNVSIVPPSVVPARSLATSGVGVSMGAASSATPRRMRTPLLALGAFSVLAAGTGSWLFWGRAHSGDAATPAAASAGAARAAVTARSGEGEPLVEPEASRALVASAAPPSVTPTPSATPPASALPPAGTDQPPPPAAAPSAKPRPAALTSPLPVSRPAGRADERGLAKKNPFK